MTPMLDCEAVMRQLWDFLDEELDATRMLAIREHLAVCARCHPQFEFERTFLEALASAQRVHSDPQRVRERVMTALRSEGFAAA
jgi:mycothiol system anti-sigma-R factor